jgi:hypothetical protein
VSDGTEAEAPDEDDAVVLTCAVDAAAAVVFFAAVVAAVVVAAAETAAVVAAADEEAAADVVPEVLPHAHMDAANKTMPAIDKYFLNLMIFTPVCLILRIIQANLKLDLNGMHL